MTSKYVNRFTCSDFLVINTPKALLKNEDNKGLSGGSCSKKEYSFFNIFSSDETYFPRAHIIIR